MSMDESTLVFIEQCGHVCSIEKWSEFNGLVLDFLGKTNAPELSPAL